jgi:N-acetylneuraminate lyase
MIQLLASQGFMGAAKAVMTMLGVPVGPARLPNNTLTADQASRLCQKLDELGFFDWIKKGASSG